jgi:hypothetical protein
MVTVSPVGQRAAEPPAARRLMHHGTPGTAIRKAARGRGAAAAARPSTVPVQRACACGGGGGGGGECHCDEKKEEPAPAPVQRTVAAPAGTDGDAADRVGEALRGGGAPLEGGVRAAMEAALGADFRAVRVHTGRSAARSARALHALAYTTGTDIVFAGGRFAPHTIEGRTTLAHELTHVLQQARGPVAGTPVAGGRLAVSEPGDRFEREAEAVAARLAQPAPRGGHPAPLSRGGVRRAVQRQSADTGPAPGVTGPAPGDGGPAPGDGGPVGGGGGAVPPGTGPCPTVPVATPPACPGRHDAYCTAASCIKGNPWLPCVCTASRQVCEAGDAFTFKGTQGGLLYACINLPLPNPLATRASLDKGTWFLSTNACIWGYWRKAFDAIHDASLLVPAGLTPEWAAAVSTCRAKGIGSPECCRAHVTAEQTAIDACGPYDSSRFGALPTDVPWAPVCSAIIARMAPPPAFSGDFGKVADRIAYGNRRCCS